MEKTYSSNIISDIFNIIEKINRERLEGKLEKTIEEEKVIISIKKNEVNYRIVSFYDRNFLYGIAVWEEIEKGYHLLFELQYKDKKPGGIVFDPNNIERIINFYRLL